MIGAVLKTSGFPTKKLHEKDLEKLLTINKHEQKKFLDLVHEIAVIDFLEILDSEGNSIGAGWPELRPLTMNIRRKTGFAPEHPIHVRSGALRRTIRQGGRWRIRIGTHQSSASLSFSHKATRSMPGQDSKPSGNLFDDLHEGYSDPSRGYNREPRHMYDQDGYGVSRAAVDEMTEAFVDLCDDVMDRILKEFEA